MLSSAKGQEGQLMGVRTGLGAAGRGRVDRDMEWAEERGLPDLRGPGGHLPRDQLA